MILYYITLTLITGCVIATFRITKLIYTHGGNRNGKSRKNKSRLY